MERPAVDAPADLLEEVGVARLHIGGKQAKQGWQILNAVPGSSVDHVGDLRDLSRFADASWDMVYASHVLEHVPYAQLPAVTRGIARILRPGGRFFVSVPDLKVLSELFLDPDLTDEKRFVVMQMMFGGQTDAYDFHSCGLWDSYLGKLLAHAGFARIFRVPAFELFNDASAQVIEGTPISLNMIAVR